MWRNRRSASTGRPVRVLWLIKGLGPGGAERLLQLAAERRNRTDFSYEAAYVLPYKNHLVGSLEAQGVPVHCLNGGAEYDLRWALRLRRLLKKGCFDILHLHSPYVAAIARLVVRTLPRSKRPKVISTEHVPWFGYVRPTRLLNGATFRLDDVHLAVSHAVRDSIPEALKNDVEVIVHGIALDRVRSEAVNRERSRRELGIADDEILIGTVANFRAQKGYPNLLATAHILSIRGLPVRFVAVGQGPLEGQIRRDHEKLGLGDRFMLLGGLDNPARVLAGCDLFVLASLYEGLPLAMMEAFALGLPVVVTNVPGIKEGLTDGTEGVLVPVSRPDLLAWAIEDVITDPERMKRMSQAALKRSGDYDISRAVSRTEAIYTDLATLQRVAS
ncbi:MAG: glycosyltransferase [Actinomycetota bacterium]